jgi:L-lactate dehydrogenase complex protein LldG
VLLPKVFTTGTKRKTPAMGEPAESSAPGVILNAVRRALPKAAVLLPDIPLSSNQEPVQGGLGYQGHLTALEMVQGFPKPGEPLAAYFQKQLAAMGGQSFVVSGYDEARSKIASLFPEANVICSVVPGIPGNRPIIAGQGGQAINDVDVAVLRSRLGVAEAGAVWLNDADLVIPALGVLAQHLVVLLNPEDIVPTLHEAYTGRFHPADHAYSLFMAGPSATGDIEGVIIHGAQGARSLTVLLAGF